MRAAAHRHLLAGEILVQSDRKDVAGYLFGIAAECALKALMKSVGIKELPREERRDDPFYAHFGAIKVLLRDSIEGRKHKDVLKYATNNEFMTHWDTDMRYSDGKTIQKRWVERWRDDAKTIIGEI